MFGGVAAVFEMAASWCGLQPGAVSACGCFCRDSREELGKALFPASVGFLWWLEGRRASLTLSLLGYQMPVPKRPRKSSSDLDQGSPSLTEEENSETSSESEKNSDQVRRFWDTLAWKLAGWWVKGCSDVPEHRHLGEQWLEGTRPASETLVRLFPFLDICVFLQDFTPEKKPVARAPRRMPAGGRKKKVKGP